VATKREKRKLGRDELQRIIDMLKSVEERGLDPFLINVEDIITMSERVYNFQRLFNLRMGYGTREHDSIPYRSVGPVTKDEYESRAERYDKQLRERVGYDPSGKSTEEKMTALRSYREREYERLRDAVYKRRGWSNNGVPTLEKIEDLGIDFPDIVKLIRDNSGHVCRSLR
jgi:aldehyde:ferredoxin oxidoreductase